MKHYRLYGFTVATVINGVIVDGRSLTQMRDVLTTQQRRFLRKRGICWA